MSKHGRVTIQEVADAAGVSPATVSRALSRPGRVNYRTMQKVVMVARELGYRTEKVDAFTEEPLRGMIAVIVPDIDNPAFSTLIRSIQETGAARGFSTVVSDFGERPERERRLLDNALHHSDGIILAAPRLSDTVIRKAAQSRPIVVMNRVIGGLTCVTPDLSSSLDEAVGRLAQLGHRRLTYLAGPADSWQDGYRHQIIHKACRDRGMPLHTLRGTMPTYRGGWHDFRGFLAHPTTAVIAYNDVMALGFMGLLRQHGIVVPERVSVMGIDGTRLSLLFDPPLAGIIIPRNDMGRRATDRCIDMVLHSAGKDAVVDPVPTSFLNQPSLGPHVSEPR